MGDNDIEEQDTFPVERDEEGDNRANPKRRGRRVEKIQKNVSKWMLPEELRETYLERANCCPPPIFIILISLAEVQSNVCCKTSTFAPLEFYLSGYIELFILSPQLLSLKLQQLKPVNVGYVYVLIYVCNVYVYYVYVYVYLL